MKTKYLFPTRSDAWASASLRLSSNLDCKQNIVFDVSHSIYQTTQHILYSFCFAFPRSARERDRSTKIPTVFLFQRLLTIIQSEHHACQVLESRHLLSWLLLVIIKMSTSDSNSLFDNSSVQIGSVTQFADEPKRRKEKKKVTEKGDYYQYVCSTTMIKSHQAVCFRKNTGSANKSAFKKTWKKQKKKKKKKPHKHSQRQPHPDSMTSHQSLAS